MDEGVVEGGEDTGNAKDELACWDMVSANGSWCDSCVAILAVLTLADLGTEGDVLLRSADGGFLGGHGDGIWTTGVVFSRSLESSTKRRSLKARDAARCGPAELKVRRRLAKTRPCLRLSKVSPSRSRRADGVRAPPLFLRDFIQSC